jgi:hypothetical protein
MYLLLIHKRLFCNVITLFHLYKSTQCKFSTFGVPATDTPALASGKPRNPFNLEHNSSAVGSPGTALLFSAGKHESTITTVAGSVGRGDLVKNTGKITGNQKARSSAILSPIGLVFSKSCPFTYTPVPLTEMLLPNMWLACWQSFQSASDL